MKRSFRMLLCALLAVAGVGVFGAGAFGADVTITLGQAAFTGSGDNRGVYYPELTISSFGAGTYKGIMVAFTGELVATDEIKISAVDGISENTGCSTKVSKIIKFDGDKSSAQIQNFLRNGVKLYSQKNPKGQKVRLLLLKAAVDRATIYCDKTQHYYQYVKYSGAKSWLDSYKEAKGMTFMGRRGYLATITSLAEDQFVHKACDGKVGWLGGTMLAKPAQITVAGESGDPGTKFYQFADDASSKYYDEGRGDPRYRYYEVDFPAGLNTNGWYWACGPECGQIFFDAMLIDAVKEHDYKNWHFDLSKKVFLRNEQKKYYFNWRDQDGVDGAEPNYGVRTEGPYCEPCLTTLSITGGRMDGSFSWNNIMCNRHDGNGTYQPSGYFVEFGNLPVGNDPEIPADSVSVDGDLPGVYWITYKAGDGNGADRTIEMLTGVVTNLAALSQLGFTAPAGRPNFFGWSKTQGATVPDLIDQQPTQDYAPVQANLSLYAVWTDKPVITGRLMTRKEAETFLLKAIGFDRKEVGALAVADGGGNAANLVYYAFSAPRGVYGFDITEKANGYGAWVDLVTIETDGVMAGPDFTQARIWDTLGNGVDYKSGLDKYALIGRFSQIRGANAKRPILFKTMPIFATAEQTDWATLKFAEALGVGGGATDKRILYHHPEVQATIRGADGGISARMKERWPALAEARSPDFMQIWLKMIGRYACLVNSMWYVWNWPGPEPIYRNTTYATDIAPALKADEFVVAAIQDSDCRVSTTNLPWRIYRYYKGEDGKEHYDVIKQRHVGSEYTLANGSDGEDLGEYIELRDGYALIYLKRFGQFAFIDPTDVEIFPGEQYKQDESTWGWTNMTAYGEMKYDRMELTLHNADASMHDTFTQFPSDAGWTTSGSSEYQHLVSTNTTESTNVSICDIATNVLSKVRLKLPSNGEDIYWSIKLYRADGYKPYEFDIGISNAWYVVAYRPTIPGAGDTVYVTYKNVRTIKTPQARENLGFGIDGKVFYCWQRDGLNFLDDGQPFFDISKAFQTNYLDACWVDTPVISGDCPTNVNALTRANLVMVGGMTNAVPGDVLFAGAEPGRYVATAVPGIYNLVYSDKDGLPHTELIELVEGRRTGPSFVDDKIATGVDNTGVEPRQGLLAGGLRAYDESVYVVCSRYFNETHGHDYDHFTTPRFDLVASRVTGAEREALQGAAAYFAVRAKMSMTFLSTPDPAYRYDWVPAMQSDPSRIGQPGFFVGTNLLVDLIVPFDTRPFAGCTNTWAISRMGDDGNIETLTTEPNEKGELLALADDYLRLTVKTFGVFGVRPPNLTTTIDLGAADYTNEYGVSYFPAAQGSGDRLYSSVRVDLKNFDASSAVLGMVEMGLFDPSTYGAEALTNSTKSSLCVRFDTPRTAAEIAAFIAHCLWIDSDYSFVGADVTVSCFENDTAEGTPQYTSEASHIKTRAAALVFRPGARGTVNGDDVDFVAPSNSVQYLIPAELFFELGFWKTNESETVNTYFYGWEFEGKVCFGAEQRVLNKFRIGETNVLTAVWTNMPVVAGDVAHDSGAASVTVQSLTNALEATIFKGGAGFDRYALPLPAGRPYNVAVEYRDTVGGEVKSVETALVTNDVVRGAMYDSTGRVETATSVWRPAGDPDFVLVGGLASVTGDIAAVVANAGHLASGAIYEALTNAVGTNEGIYFDLGLTTNGVAAATVDEPVTVLLPLGDPEVFDPTHLAGVYRYSDGAAVEVPASEYANCGDYLELVSTTVAPVAVVFASDVEIVPGEQVLLGDMTWGWTNMTAGGTMTYDRIELTLNNPGGAADRIVFPEGTDWLPTGEQTGVSLVYTNAAGSSGVSVREIAADVLSKVQLVLPSNGDGITWTIRLSRADGRWTYELEVGYSVSWYSVVYRPMMPGAGAAQLFTYTNSRVCRAPLAGEGLGFAPAGLNFFCWKLKGREFLDDGQSFVDIGGAYQTNSLDAAWVETPVISGDCPTNVSGGAVAKLVSVGETNAVTGHVLYVGAAPARYVATAQPGLYELVFSDEDGLPHTELVELTSGRMTGPDYASDLIATGVSNADAEPGFKLLAGGLRDYEAAVFGLCLNYFNDKCPDFDDFTLPRLDLVSARVTDAERTALAATSHCFAVRAKMSTRFFSAYDPDYWFDWKLEAQSDPAKLGTTGYLVGTNVLVDLIVPFDTLPFEGCTNTWAIARRGDDGAVDTLTTTPNEKGEYFTLADDYLRLKVETFGAFGIKTPDLTTLIDLGAPVYSNELAAAFFGQAQGSGDRLYGSVRVNLANVDGSGSGIRVIDEARHGVTVLPGSTATSLLVTFGGPKTAAEIAAFLRDCCFFDVGSSIVGGDVTVSCFVNGAAEGEAQYTSEAAHVATRVAVLRFEPGDRSAQAVRETYLTVVSNVVRRLPPVQGFFDEGAWQANPAETVDVYFYGWAYEGKVCFGDTQQVLNRFRIGETNVLTAVWTNMPVVAGDVAHDSGAASVTVQSFTNALEATIFKGGAGFDRYALPLPAGRLYNVAVEYRDTVGGEVKSVETALVTNDVVSGAMYDSTGRVETATSVWRPAGDPDFVLVGGLASVTGDIAAVVANAGHLASGAIYEALTNAVGTNEGIYFDLGLTTNGVAAATVDEPVTVLLPLGDPEVFDPTHLAGVYRYSDGAAVEVPASEYANCGDYLELVSTTVAPVAVVFASDVEIVPGEQVLLGDMTWGWTNMTAGGTMTYDRIELTLNNPGGAGDRIVFPEGTDWLPAGEQTPVHQVYTNAAGSSGVSVREIAADVLSKVQLVLPSNGEGITWTIRLTRADGRWTYALDIGYSTSWYAVVYRPTMPGVGTAQLFTYTNARAYTAPLAGADLGFAPAGQNFYCWNLKGRETLDDGQSFVDIGGAYQTNSLDAAWVETPVISGDCPTNVSGGAEAKLVSVGETNAVTGHVLYVGAAPARYVATAQPGLYELVFSDEDGLPHTELVELSSGRMTGPDYAADLIATGVSNADAEPGFKLLAGGLRDYEAAVFGLCLNYFNDKCPDFDDFTLPRLDLVSARVTDAERTALAATSHCFAVRAKMSTRFFSAVDLAYYYDFTPPVQSDPAKLGTTGYLVGTNILVDLIVPFDTESFEGCTNTWAISRRGDDGNVETLTTTPNEKGEGFVVTNGYLLLTVERFGAFGIKTPDLKTVIDLGVPVYSNELAAAFFGQAQGSGDRLYGSVRVNLANVDGSGSGIRVIDAARHGVTVLPGSTATSLLVRFAGPKTAAEIAAFLRDCCFFDVGSSVVGGDVTVSCFVNDTAEGEAQYTSEAAHLATRVAVLRFEPGDRFAQAVRETYLLCASNEVMRLPAAQDFFDQGAWKPNPAETVDVYFYGWKYEGEVCLGDTQQVLNRFRIGETNVLTAVWTNMPVVAGDVAHDSGAATVSVQSLTNALAATIFTGGAELDRYALALPADRPYNVAVEYRDTVGGEVKSVETVLVTNDVVSGATYDSTGRVATATSVQRPAGDPDFVLVGGLERVTGNFAAVVAKAGHLASGAAYEALKTAVGTKVGTYFDLALTKGAAVAATAPVPLTILLPYDTSAVFGSTGLFKVYRYWNGKAVEVPQSEYVFCNGYLALVSDKVAPVALAKSEPIVFEGCGKDTLRWKRTSTRSSYFAAIRLKLVSGDVGSLQDACFLFEDRISNRVDGVAVTNACLWGGRLDRQNKSNRIASQTVRVNGTVFRKVPLEFFREAACNADATGLVTYGVTDASYANSEAALLPKVGSAPTAVVTNAWAHQTEIEVVSRPDKQLGDTPETLSGVMGFLGYSTGGERMTYLALASGDQGGVTNYEAVVSNITAAALASADPARMLQLVSEGPISLEPANLSRISTSLAVTAIVDENSDPYCRIVDVAFGETEIIGRVEVGAGDVKGAVGRNASVTLRGAVTVDGPYEDLQTIQSVGADGLFRFSRPSDCSFFKLRIDVQDL